MKDKAWYLYVACGSSFYQVLITVNYGISKPVIMCPQPVDYSVIKCFYNSHCPIWFTE